MLTSFAFNIPGVWPVSPVTVRPVDPVIVGLTILALFGLIALVYLVSHLIHNRAIKRHATPPAWIEARRLMLETAPAFPNGRHSWSLPEDDQPSAGAVLAVERSWGV